MFRHVLRGRTGSRVRLAARAGSDLRIKDGEHPAKSVTSAVHHDSPHLSSPTSSTASCTTSPPPHTYPVPLPTASAPVPVHRIYAFHKRPFLPLISSHLSFTTFTASPSKRGVMHGSAITFPPAAPLASRCAAGVHASVYAAGYAPRAKHEYDATLRPRRGILRHGSTSSSLFLPFSSSSSPSSPSCSFTPSSSSSPSHSPSPSTSPSRTACVSLFDDACEASPPACHHCIRPNRPERSALRRLQCLLEDEIAREDRRALKRGRCVRDGAALR